MNSIFHFQRLAADLTAAEAAPQHRGHPGDLPPGPLLRPDQHSGASDHEVGDNHFMYFSLTSPLGAKHVAYVAIFNFNLPIIDNSFLQA